MFKSIITHSGKFHADEVIATAILIELFPEAEIIRTRDPEVIEIANSSKTSIVIDVGGGEYDHHYKGSDKRRENGEPYSSAGLVWKEFGEMYIFQIAQGFADVPREKWNSQTVKNCAAMVDERFIRFIDRHDNGIHPRRDVVGSTTFSALISSMNPPWFSNDKIDEDDCFIYAFELAMSVLLSLATNAFSECLAYDEVWNAIEHQGNPEVLVFKDRGLPWKPHLNNTHNAKFVVHPDNNNMWVALAVADSSVGVVDKNHTGLKIPFPESWGGLSGKELSEVAGVDDLEFCHKGQYILVAKTFEAITRALDVVLKY